MHCDHCGKDYKEDDLTYFMLCTEDKELETLMCDRCAYTFVDMMERFTKREFALMEHDSI